MVEGRFGASDMLEFLKKRSEELWRICRYIGNSFFVEESFFFFFEWACFNFRDPMRVNTVV